MISNGKIINDEKDIGKLVQLSRQIIRLQNLQGGTDRQAMIRELCLAQSLAREEILKAEQKDGDIYQIPWESFPTEDLSRKLYQYIQALRNKGMNEIGEKAFKEFFENVKKEL